MSLQPALDYWLVADESGNDGEALQVLAGISGEAGELEIIEGQLRGVLDRSRLGELKWAGLRTRSERHDVAREFLHLACEAAIEGRLWVDLLIFELPLAPRSWQGLPAGERWLALYQALVLRARRRKPRSPWSLLPDQRTGIPWKRLARSARLRQVKEASSKDWALIQLADLLAGLTRFSLEGRQAAAPRARQKRQALLDEFLLMLETAKLGSLKAGRGRREPAFRLWKLRNLSGVTRG